MATGPDDLTQPRPSYILGKSPDAPAGGSLQRQHLRAFLLGKLGFQVPGTGQTPLRTAPPVLPPTEDDVDLWLDELFGGDDPAENATSPTPHQELHERAVRNQQAADEGDQDENGNVDWNARERRMREEGRESVSDSTDKARTALYTQQSNMTDTDSRHPKHAADLHSDNPNKDRENSPRTDANTEPDARAVLGRPSVVTTSDGKTLTPQPDKGKAPQHGEPKPEPEVRRKSNL